MFFKDLAHALYSNSVEIAVLIPGHIKKGAK